MKCQIATALTKQLCEMATIITVYVLFSSGVVLTVTDTTNATSPELSFAPFINLSTETGTSGIAVGYFNNDSEMDIAATFNTILAPCNPSRLKVFLSTGNDSFDIGTIYDPGTGCWSGGGLEAADVNNDGFLDLIIAHGGSTACCFGNKITVQLGDGAGGFASPGLMFSTGGSIGNFVLGDFNEDSNIDLAIPAGDQQAIFVHFGQGDGTFVSGPVISGGAPTLVATDFNYDGHIDLVGIQANLDLVKVYLGIGDGNFSPPTSFTCPGDWGIISSDFNEDGFADLAVTNYYGGTVSILLGLGDGSFTGPQIFPAGNTPRQLDAGDLNGDGHEDLAIGNHSSTDTLVVLLGDGTGNFGSPIGFQVGQYSGQKIRIADFNADNWLDIASTSNMPQGVSILFNQCCLGIRGNIDRDDNDEINIADLVYFVNYSFGVPPGPEPPCFEEADVDASGELNIADIVYMVNYMFGSPPGPAPVDCP